MVMRTGMGWITILAATAVFTGCASVEKITTPFNGKDLTGWKVAGDPAQSKWSVGKAVVSTIDPKLLVVEKGGLEMVNAPSKFGEGVDLYSEAKFGDCHIELELMVPKDSNSGVYVMGEYEIQVLDSFGREKMGPGDIGAIYGAAAPSINASRQPGQWQKFVIDFQAPKFDAAGNKTANAKFLRVELNGKVLHENLEMKGVTPGGVTGKEAATGPIMFQGNHGPVAYRNIRITP
ncbi:MAG: DUF1080 domain-containing protein, partial [Phycisphaerae bacterium]|nr:DUF1080 domain-containing protein [Phycisphaerae bacterium]